MKGRVNDGTKTNTVSQYSWIDCSGRRTVRAGRGACLGTQESKRSIVCSGVRHSDARARSEEHTSELQSRQYLVCRLLLEKKKERLILPLPSSLASARP